MKINLHSCAGIKFTSDKDHEPGKVEYSHKFFLDQEKEALKAYYEEFAKFNDNFVHIDNKPRTSSSKINEILSNLAKKVKK